jgi:hypothetical protein
MSGRLGGLQNLQKIALGESARDQPNYDRKPNRRRQKIHGSTG